jgi:hypothetical protein
VGRELKVVLPGAVANTLQQPGTVRLYEDSGFLVGAPQHDGSLLRMLRAVRQSGVQGIYVVRQDATEPDFSEAGVFALSMIAGVEPLTSITAASQLTSHDAVILHERVLPGHAPPCITLADGTGVWLIRGNPNAPGAAYYCPLPASRSAG